ncbi:hypothetical protein N657DRAFT_649081 [Parathielavia appendiculata]|uniref:Uncharacterized protein n=1 Tax=Parathielavia appendiculata TaxID=2587402 RepID=A0AAN6TT96_9PEZI|nr:hypothetical protein N657DRAFT_649081 [Parathielavia appendiculata]
MEVTADITRSLEVRTRVVTQILTRPSTTITTIVTLGGSPTSTPTSIPFPTTPPPDPTPTTPIAQASPSGSALNPQQLGALLGSVFGLAFLVLLICCCLSCCRRRRRLQDTMYYDDGDFSNSEVVLRSTPAWNLHRHHRGTWATVPPPVHFPPTPRYTPYSQTREAQMPGVARYP